jgi:hypothetical protein
MSALLSYVKHEMMVIHWSDEDNLAESIEFLFLSPFPGSKTESTGFQSTLHLAGRQVLLAINSLSSTSQIPKQLPFSPMIRYQPIHNALLMFSTSQSLALFPSIGGLIGVLLRSG